MPCSSTRKIVLCVVFICALFYIQWEAEHGRLNIDIEFLKIFRFNDFKAAWPRNIDKNLALQKWHYKTRKREKYFKTLFKFFLTNWIIYWIYSFFFFYFSYEKLTLECSIRSSLLVNSRITIAPTWQRVTAWQPDAQNSENIKYVYIIQLLLFRVLFN